MQLEFCQLLLRSVSSASSASYLYLFWCSSFKIVHNTNSRYAAETTISAWLARREDVRRQFEVICWIALGQEPNLAECQQLLHLQLTRSELAPRGRCSGTGCC